MTDSGEWALARDRDILKRMQEELARPLKVYLAGPMRNRPNENRAEFQGGTAALRARGHLVFSPIENSTPEGGLRAAMASDLIWICLCADAVVLLDGWEDSLGATAEYATANSIGVPTYSIHEFLELK